MVLMQKPSVINAPSGRTPEKVPRWDLTGTEGCGGGKLVSWLSWMFSGYKSIYRRRSQVRRSSRGPRGRGRALPPGRALLPHGRLIASPTSSPSLLVCFRSKKDHREGFIPFGLCLEFLFCKTLKQAKKTETGTRPSVNRLVPKII